MLNKIALCSIFYAFFQLLVSFIPYTITRTQVVVYDLLEKAQNIKYILIFFLFFVLQKYLYTYGIPSIIRLISNLATRKVTLFMQELVNCKLTKLPYHLIINPIVVNAKKNSDDSASCVWDIWKNGLYVLLGIFSIIVTSLPLLALGYVIWLLFLILLVPILLFSIYAGLQYHNTWSKLAPSRRKGEYFFDVLTQKENAHERILFNLKPFFLEKWKKEFTHFKSVSIKEEMKGAKLIFLSSILQCAYISFLVLYLIQMTNLGRVTPGYSASILTVFPFILTSSIAPLSTALNDFFRNLKAYSDITQIFSLEEEKHESGFKASSEVFQTLEFIDVSFHYPDSNEMVINHLSFKCEAGKHYAFVGSNGAGKSTIVKLILRLYEASSGEIKINGINIKDFSREKLNSYVSVIFQDYTRYLTTIRDNIALGLSSSHNTNADLDRIVATISADKFINDLPRGYDSKLGEQRLEGIELSGGEWQKLALSRIMLSNSPLKILDEPTSSLDPVSENDLYKQYQKIMKDKTTIFISHRLASTSFADIIFVLDNATIAEKGSHIELMKKKGIYWSMFSRQSAFYNKAKDE